MIKYYIGSIYLAELRMKQILDEKSMIEGAREEGIKQGIKEGKMQARIYAYPCLGGYYVIRCLIWRYTILQHCRG